MPDIMMCPKCRNKSKNTASCDSCGVNFEKYQKDKKNRFDQVHQLLSAEKLTEAMVAAEKLATEFPDSTSDSLLLVSNIKRDINIEKKHKQALKLFDQGDFSQTVLLLRNIRAYSSVLNDKVVSLRQKAKRSAEDNALFCEAVEKFNAGRLAEADELFKAIHGSGRQEHLDEYLQKIGTLKKELFHQAVQCLKKNLFDSARKNFDELHEKFPAMRQETEGYIAIIAKKEEIKEDLLRIAERAGKESRFFEAKVIYSFLGWQYPEFRPRLAPYMEKIPSSTIISLADYEEDAHVDLAALGLRLDKNGFFESGTSAKIEFPEVPSEQPMAHFMVPAVVNPDPAGDPPAATVDLSGNQIADFIY